MSAGTKNCCAPGCSSSTRNSDGDISFFRFPKEEARCSLWKQFVDKPEYYKYSSRECYIRLRLCSLHFEDECYSSMQKKRLKRNALPTLLCFESVQSLDSHLTLGMSRLNDTNLSEFTQSMDNHLFPVTFRLQNIIPSEPTDCLDNSHLSLSSSQLQEITTSESTECLDNHLSLSTSRLQDVMSDSAQYCDDDDPCSPSHSQNVRIEDSVTQTSSLGDHTSRENRMKSTISNLSGLEWGMVLLPK